MSLALAFLFGRALIRAIELSRYFRAFSTIIALTLFSTLAMILSIRAFDAASREEVSGERVSLMTTIAESVSVVLLLLLVVPVLILVGVVAGLFGEVMPISTDEVEDFGFSNVNLQASLSFPHVIMTFLTTLSPIRNSYQLFQSVTQSPPISSTPKFFHCGPDVEMYVFPRKLELVN
jgi:hypothetical protein